MRDIKFRYRVRNWKTNEVIMFVCRIEDVEMRPYQPNPFGSLDWEVLSREEYTGLKDKNGTDNGTEIYEGDIIAYGNFYVGDFLERAGTGVVKYEDDGFGLYKVNTGDYRDYICAIWDAVENYGGKVIGNIHENQELLGHGSDMETEAKS